MPVSFKKNLLRSSALVGAGLVSIVASSQVSATVVNSGPTIISAQTPGNYCQVNFDVNVTGTIDDTGTGVDRFRYNLTKQTSNAQQYHNGQVTVGAPQTISAFATIAGFASSRGQWYVRVFETTAFNTVGAAITDVPVPRSVLLAGGAVCRDNAENSAPIVNAGANRNEPGGAPLALNGTATDADNDALTIQWIQTAGPAVTLTGGNTLTPSFTPAVNNGAPIAYTFVLRASDGIVSPVDSAVTLQVANNAPPVVNAGTDATAIAQNTVNLSGTATDPEMDPLTYQWSQTAGPPVTLNGATTLTPNFTAPAKAAAAQILTFSLVANDGTSNSPADSVNITVPANVGPTANAGPDATAGATSTVTLDGSASADGDGDAITYAWTQTGGPAVTLTGANTASPSFTAPVNTAANQLLTFSLTVSDGITSSAADTVVITIPPNAPPTVDAGTDANANGGDNVTLSGSANDLDSDPLTYSWTQTAGPTVTLNGANTLAPSFTAPAKTASVQVLTFSLVANDGTANSAADTVDVTVAANVGPVANAGPDAVAGATTSVTLNGAASADGDGDPLTYAWTQTGGPAVTLVGANTATPSFTAPASAAANQILTFSLTVSDGITTSAADSVDITIPANAAPMVNAGPDAGVNGGDNVSLAGTASDTEMDPLTYLWTQTAGPAVTLTGATTLTPSFTAPPRAAAAQILTFSLIANDGTSNSAADTVDITVAANVAPLADAGNDVTFPAGSVVTLEGFGTDADNDPLTLLWSQVSGPAVTLSGATTGNPSFTAPAKTNAVQVLTFSLVANDGTASSAPDTANVTIPANVGPVADAGADASVAGGASVTLDGSASADGDGDPLTYSWVQTGGPAVTLSSATAVSPTFTAPAAALAAQVISFDLVVSDGLTTSTADSVDITVAANAPPVANAGVDQGPIDSGSTVTLNGAASNDPDGDPLTYTWMQVSGTPVSLTGGNSVTPTFVAPLVNGNENLVFQLVVSDGQVSSVADSVTIGIRAVGNITIIQRVTGSDTSFAFTSSVAALNGSIATSGGSGQLVASSVSAGNHSVSAADLSAQGYALTDISCNDSDSVISLSGRSVALALSPNENLVCTFTSANSREAATTAINNFLTGRNALILSHQPDLQRRIDRLQGQSAAPGSASAFGLPVPGSGKLPFNMALTNGQGSASTSLAMVGAATGDPDRGKQPFDIWAEAYFSRATLGTQRANFRIVHLGADYRVGDNLLIGVLGEFDDLSNKGPLKAGEAEGHGWMAGPYMMSRIAPGLYGELRAAWGKSDNTVSPLGTYSDGFKTGRSLYSGSLIGQFDLGDDTNIRPEITIRHLSEKAKAYTDSLNIAIPGQTVGQGDISFRPRIQHSIKFDSGWALRPYGEVEGIYTFGTSLNTVLDNGLRARIEGGMDIFSNASFRASISAFHDGIGSSNYRSTGGHVSVSFGF